MLQFVTNGIYYCVNDTCLYVHESTYVADLHRVRFQMSQKNEMVQRVR